MDVKIAEQIQQEESDLVAKSDYLNANRQACAHGRRFIERLRVIFGKLVNYSLTQIVPIFPYRFSIKLTFPP